MSRRIRQYIGIFAAVISYYIVHEGAHLITALYYGVFKQINFMGLGMQVDAYTDRMTDFQLGIFCLVGSVATMLFGWLLVLLCRRICAVKSKVFKTIMWYVSLAILLIDPLYLSVLCGFFGGGDMNGIKLLFPEIAVRIVFAVIGIAHSAVIWKYLLPEYTKAFQECCTMKFMQYSHEDYQAVCDFLIALNQPDKTHINWNWARWEWMYAHPYCDRTLLQTIGLWKNGGVVAGAAIYDMYHGEAFCAALDGYAALLPEILDYAYRSLGDENGLGIAVNDADARMQRLLTDLGYEKAEQTETVLCRDLTQAMDYKLPHGFAIQEIRFPEDDLAYQTVIWKGFDHEGDQAELDKMLHNEVMPPHRVPNLCLAVVDDNGEFTAHCTCWYDARTDYAYVEPVCTIPKYRGMGLGKAVVLEALDRCRKLGAKEAYVISDQDFYKKLGFESHSHYTFYWKR